MRREYGKIEDKRHQPFVEHTVADILILTQCAVMCGIQTLEEISEYGRSKKAWLRETFGITRIASDSTLSRVLSMVNAEAVVSCVVEMMKRQIGVNGDQIALDGKTIRATAKEGTEQETLHIVSMYMTQTGVILGQRSVPEKTNEIPVVRELLALFELGGRVVTADAMHCSRETAELIIRQGGDYVLALKGNQSLTHDEIKTYLDACIADGDIVQSATTREKNRDRMETRTCWKAPNLDWFESKGEWASLTSAYAIERCTGTKEKTTRERAYYISSLDAPPERILALVRNHWRIESMHWMLDVLFGEDNSRLQNANAHLTLNIFRKNAIALHQRSIAALPQKTKPSIKSNMLRAALNDGFLPGMLSMK